MRRKLIYVSPSHNICFGAFEGTGMGEFQRTHGGCESAGISWNMPSAYIDDPRYPGVRSIFGFCRCRILSYHSQKR